MLTLARGAANGIGKRPSASAALPDTRLTRRAVCVDPERVAQYAAVCGFPEGRPDLPLTYPHILGFPLAARLMAARGFPLPLMGLVHTSITVDRYGPLLLGDRPDLTVYAEELRPHRRGTEVVMVTEVRLGGRLVWEDRSTYLARHGSPPAGAAQGAAEPPGVQEPQDAKEPPAAKEPLSAGPPAPAQEWRLPADLGRRHARVSGDWNPIHLYALTARAFGFPRAIAHGMWTVARCAAAEPGVSGMSADFLRPVLLPSTVAYASAGDRFEVRSGAGLHLTGTRRFA
jgi:acyl dehydratase